MKRCFSRDPTAKCVLMFSTSGLVKFEETASSSMLPHVNSNAYHYTTPQHNYEYSTLS